MKNQPEMEKVYTYLFKLCVKLAKCASYRITTVEISFISIYLNLLFRLRLILLPDNNLLEKVLKFLITNKSK